MTVPDEPPIDTITAYLLNMFRNVSRGRRYIAGMSGAVPLPLSARQITDWLEAHPSPMPRTEIDDVIFALDALTLVKDDEEQ